MEPQADSHEPLPQPKPDEPSAGLESRLQAALTILDRMYSLLETAGDRGPNLDRATALRRTVEAAVRLAGARYGALAVTGEDQRLIEFVPVGLDEAGIRKIGRWPEGRGLLGLPIREGQSLRVADITQHPESSGFPDGHPPMRSFLGVPLRLRGKILGSLYLADKVGGGEFTRDDEAVLSALGGAAGISIENARLHEEAQRQQRWLQASTEITTSLLSGAEPGEVLATVTKKALELSGADLVWLAMPDEEQRWLTIDYAEGDGAADTRGLVVPVDRSIAHRVLRSGEPLAIDNSADGADAAWLEHAPAGRLGHVVAFPLGAPDDVRGVLHVGHRYGRLPLPPATADLVASFAAQAGIALKLADRRRDAERLSLYEDRDRIARDLHDLVIQRLYATGMSLQAMVPMVVTPEVAGRVQDAVDAMDETIRDIRTTIFALQSREQSGTPDLRGEIVNVVGEMTPLLGFDPSLRLGGGLRVQVPREAGEQMLTALREALSNTARHADATQADVSVDVDADGNLTLRVTDNGTGIPPGSRCSGLRNLGERAGKLGGELSLGAASATGQGRPGTELVWRVPCGSPAPAGHSPADGG